MRSFSDTNLLTVIIFALVVCVLLNLQTTLWIAERVYEVSLSFLTHALSFV
jgi:hypothetical protein